MTDGFTVPDVAGVVEGYRVFRPLGDRLRSSNQDFFWEPGANEALCLANPKPLRAWKNGPDGLVCVKIDQHGRIPSPECACGFWFYREPREAWGLYGPSAPDLFGFWSGRTGARLLGRIQGWGRVIEGRSGWRSEFAAVVELLTDEPDKWASIIQHYGVSVAPMIPSPQEPEQKPASGTDFQTLMQQYQRAILTPQPTTATGSDVPFIFDDPTETAPTPETPKPAKRWWQRG